MAQQKPQNNNDELIQVSGFITQEGGLPVPYTTVRIKNTFRGTISGVEGFYTLPAKERDTLQFIAFNFDTAEFVIPIKPLDGKVSHNVVLHTDTFMIDVTTIYPWPSKEEFRETFLNLKLDKTYEDIARQNLDQQKLQALYETLAKDGEENQIYTLQQMARSYYYSGGQKNYALLANGTPVPTSLLNPFAWAEFIKAIKEGKFKKK